MPIPHWTAVEARKYFSQLLQQAKNSPQWVYRRNKPVAVVLDIETYQS